MNEFPDLPRQLKRKEADFGIKFRRWWELHGMNAPYELKDTRGKNCIAFSELADEQIAIGLQAMSDKGVLIRVGKGTTGSPDYVGFKNSPYWIVIHFPKAFYVIALDRFLHEKAKSERKSLVSSRAEQIAEKVIHT